MNELIETIFKNFTVDNKKIPVSFVRYTGTETTYITYQLIQMNDSLSADNSIINYVDYYDFDIYSKGNYLNILESVKSLLGQNGFIWQPSMSSGDMFEDDTKYFHRTLCFAYMRNNESNNIIPTA